LLLFLHLCREWAMCHGWIANNYAEDLPCSD
jgi:hypothetical protein